MNTYDPAPLIEAAQAAVRKLRLWKLAETGQEPQGDQSDIAEVLGVNARTVHRWKLGTRISFWDADTFACRLGFHPIEVWPEWLEPEMTQCSLPGCGETFVVSNTGHPKQFCSRKCADMALVQRKRDAA